MDEQQRPEHPPKRRPEGERGTRVIEPDSELGRAMTRARERWEWAAPAETIGVDEAALHKVLDEDPPAAP
jgi:hypothetical protein